MRTRWLAAALDRVMQRNVAGAVAALTIAAVIYSQHSLYSKLSRDASIYIYGGQQLVHGVPPYASIMDPKGPLSGILCGFGVGVARLFGSDEVLVIRAEFCALAVLSVLGVYLLVLELWHSVVAGVVAAAVFTSFRPYAHQALGGPDGHMPGTVFFIFALWLTVRKQWYWAGFTAALAFLVWQPLGPFPIIAFLCAVVWSPGRRWRAAGWSAAGIVSPIAALLIYYAAEGYPGKLWEGLIVFPLTGVHRKPMTVGQHLRFFFSDVPASFGASAVLFWAGLVLLLVAVLWTVIAARAQWRAALVGPMVLLILLSFVTQVAYVMYDYIGSPHSYPLMPYAAAGAGAATAALLRWLTAPRARQVAVGVLLAGVTAGTAACAVAYYEPSARSTSPLRAEEAASCVMQRSLVPGTPLRVLGNPLPLVFLRRRNPDNYPYVGSGLDFWKIKHTPGGFDGWTAQIAGSSIVVVDTWHSPLHEPMAAWLKTHGYTPGYIGIWRVFVTKGVQDRMADLGISLSYLRSPWPLTTAGKPLRGIGCLTDPA